MLRPGISPDPESTFTIIRVPERTRGIATYRNAFLIYNPFAGQLMGRKEHVLRRALDILRNCVNQVQAVSTTGPAMASDLARGCIAEGADLILVAGGDGTINEVVNGMVHSPVPLGILPAGTANVLATELGLGRTMHRAAAILGDCVPGRVSLGRIQSDSVPEARHFLLMAGAGLDAHIVYHLNPSLKISLGKAAYWVSGFAQLGRRLPEFDVLVEDRRFRCSFALASRVRNYGGDLEIAKNASLLEDYFELVLFEGRNPSVYLKYMMAVLAGRLERVAGVTVLQARRAEIVPAFSRGDEPIFVQVDGENAGTIPATIEIVPSALTLLMPPVFFAKIRKRAPAQQWIPLPTR